MAIEFELSRLNDCGTYLGDTVSTIKSFNDRYFRGWLPGVSRPLQEQSTLDLDMIYQD